MTPIFQAFVAKKFKKVNCATCGDKRACRHALDDGTAVQRHAAFCPNADDLAELADRRHFRP